MRLRRSALSEPGITRRRRGQRFLYYGVDDRRVTDAQTRARIEELVIPPAWRKVWISPHPNGHIQAVGTDAAGRRQYLYHQAWQQERAEAKFDRVLEMSGQLPQWRRRIVADLNGRGLARDRVIALALLLLDLGYFRAGGEQYAEEHESYGLATLRRDHVTVRETTVVFDYPAKSGVRRTLEIDNPEVTRAVRALMRRDDRSERLLVCRSDSGFVEIRAGDINARFKELVGTDYSVKDLRTWHATVLAAQAFALAEPAVSERSAKKNTASVMKAVAEELGNTPAVARGSYVDPRVVAAYQEGRTIEAAARRAARLRRPGAAQEALERATRALIRRVARIYGRTSRSTKAA